MVQTSCIVVGCSNTSVNSKVTWHRITKKLDVIKRILPLPTLNKIMLKNYRICSTCFSKIKIPSTRKSPKIRKVTTPSSTRPQRFTREELRRAIANDHTYASSSLSTSDQITPVNNAEFPSISTIPDSILKVNFCIEMYMNDDEAVTFYTSFPSYHHMLICFEFLGDAVNHLIYPGSHSSHQQTRIKHRSLSPLNEFFRMTLCRLRRGLPEQDLAYRFQVSQSSVSRICTTWINFLYHKFKEVPIWPSRSQIDLTMPTSFKCLYPQTRVILDGTEIFIQRPSNPGIQQLTFSSYKNNNTVKVLIGITPSGAVSFVSKAYCGSISDRELFIESGIAEKLDMGSDSVMADKGFNVADILSAKGISLNIPPRKSSNQFSEIELVETRRIASIRIHVERAIGRIKSFHILHNVPNNLASLVGEIVYVCAFLTSFQPPLIKEDNSLLD